MEPQVANIHAGQGMTIAQPGQEVLYYGLTFRVKGPEWGTQQSIKREQEIFETIKASIEKPPLDCLAFVKDGIIERFVTADLEQPGEIIVTYRLPFALKYKPCGSPGGDRPQNAKLVEAARERQGQAIKPRSLWGRLLGAKL